MGTVYIFQTNMTFQPNKNQWNSQFGTTQFGNSEFDSLPDQNQTFSQPTNGFNQQPTDFSRLENAIEDSDYQRERGKGIAVCICWFLFFSLTLTFLPNMFYENPYALKECSLSSESFECEPYEYCRLDDWCGWAGKDGVHGWGDSCPAYNSTISRFCESQLWSNCCNGYCDDKTLKDYEKAKNNCLERCSK